MGFVGFQTRGGSEWLQKPETQEDWEKVEGSNKGDKVYYVWRKGLEQNIHLI